MQIIELGLDKIKPYKNNPISKIDEMNAGMYKGEKITQQERHVDDYLDSVAQ